MKSLVIVICLSFVPMSAFSKGRDALCDFDHLAEALLEVSTSDEREVLSKVELMKTEPLFWGDALVEKARAIAESCHVKQYTGLVDDKPWLLLFLDSDWSTRAILVAAAQLERQDQVDLRWVRIAFATELLASIPIVESRKELCDATTPAPLIIRYDPKNAWKSRSAFYATCPNGRKILYLPERGWFEPSGLELGNLEKQLAEDALEREERRKKRQER